MRHRGQVHSSEVAASARPHVTFNASASPSRSNSRYDSGRSPLSLKWRPPFSFLCCQQTRLNKCGNHLRKTYPLAVVRRPPPRQMEVGPRPVFHRPLQ